MPLQSRSASLALHAVSKLLEFISKLSAQVICAYYVSLLYSLSSEAAPTAAAAAMALVSNTTFGGNRCACSEGEDARTLA